MRSVFCAWLGPVCSGRAGAVTGRTGSKASLRLDLDGRVGLCTLAWLRAAGCCILNTCRCRPPPLPAHLQAYPACLPPRPALPPVPPVSKNGTRPGAPPAARAATLLMLVLLHSGARLCALGACLAVPRLATARRSWPPFLPQYCWGEMMC